MTVGSGQLVFYASSGMPVYGDLASAGGPINSGVRVFFNSLVDSNVRLSAFSSAAADSGEVRVSGLGTGGNLISENFIYSGTGHFYSTNNFSGVLSAMVSRSGNTAGTVTLSGEAKNLIAEVPPTETGIIRPFFLAQPTGQTIYEKLFIKNRNSNTSLLDATFVPTANTGFSSEITYGLENCKTDGVGCGQTVPTRLTAPTGVDFFGSGNSGVWPNGTGNLDPLEAQPFWLKLSTTSGVQKNSFFGISMSGMTTA